MKIYIAASWRHQHAVEMLTFFLRSLNHEIVSFIENCDEESSEGFDFEKWVHTEKARQSFIYDTDGATKSNLVIYIGPSGKDAAAEIGAAYASKVPIMGLWAKGEDFGLMRKMISKWYNDYRELIVDVEAAQLLLNTVGSFIL